MPRGMSFTTVTVLNAVACGESYGFDVIDATGLPSGTVYPALGRLERDGLVRSQWGDVTIARDEGRPPRRYYRVTAPGSRVLNAELAKYRALSRPSPASAKGRA